MLAKVGSCGLMGLGGFHVDVEVDVSSGMPCMEIVGLADTAVKESRERVRSALKNAGFAYPAEQDHRQPGAGRSAQGRPYL